MYIFLAILVILLGIFLITIKTKNRIINILTIIGGVALIFMGILAIYGVISGTNVLPLN